MISQEDTGNFFEVRLSHRPSGRFRGKPGVEQFTIGKTGTIELRQVLDEPIEHRATTVLLLVAIGVVVFGVSGGVWLATGGVGGGDDEKPTAGAGPTTMSALPGGEVSPSPAAAMAAAPAAGLAESTDLGPILEPIFQKTSTVIGLEPLEEVVPTYLTSDQLLDLATRRLDKGRGEKQAALFAILGLAPRDLDLYQLWVDLVAERLTLGGEAVAFYDLDTRQLYISRDLAEPTVVEEMLVAGEYGVALLQQHYGIGAEIYPWDALAGDDLDAGMALQALVEGQIFLMGERYLLTQFDPQRMFQQNPFGFASPALDRAPDVVTRQMSLVLPGGQLLVESLLASGQDAALGNAYDSPPASTEQVHHPEKYLAGEAPVAVALPDLAGALGLGWAEVYSSALGETVLSAYLSSLAGQDLPKAAAGWGGDRFSLLESMTGEMALASLTVWDTRQDAQEFFESVSANTDISENVYVGIDEDSVLLIIGPFDAVVQKLRARFPGF